MASQGTIVAVGSIGFPPGFSALAPERLAELQVTKVMTLTSTYDHRVIQGAESGEFLRTIEDRLQGGNAFYERIVPTSPAHRRSGPRGCRDVTR
jgi:2-oxoglutarate dehydrogenase E1 component